MVRMTLEEALQRPSTIDHAKVAATTEDDIRRQMAEDGFEADAETGPWRTVLTPRAVREIHGMTQEAFAAVIGIPLATWRNWEQGRVPPDASGRALLNILAREPEAAMRALRNSDAA